MSTTVRKNQAGLVSIMVTIIMMLVISLIIIGFATVTRRNAREALDRQLSTQAYYAAETGVNDAISAINANRVSDLLSNTGYATNCSGSGSFMATLNTINSTSNQNLLNADGSVQYTCLLVNPIPGSIITTVPADDAENVPLNPSAPTTLKFSWQSQGTSGNAAACPASFQPQAAWAAACPYGILRLDIFKVTNGDADTAMANTASIFLLPTSAGAGTTAIVYGTSNVIKATCSAATSTCSAVLADAGGANFSGQYYVRESNLYRGSGNVTIEPAPAASSVTFSGADVLIDVTGKAQDETRRIQERISPSDKVTPQSSTAISSGTTVCKRFTVEGSGSSADPNDLCQP